MDDKPEGANLMVVTPSDEAFLAALCENNMEKWECTVNYKRRDVKPNPKHHAMETHYTNAKGGHRMFGDWTKAGRAQIRSLKKQIEEN